MKLSIYYALVTLQILLWFCRKTMWCNMNILTMNVFFWSGQLRIQNWAGHIWRAQGASGQILWCSDCQVHHELQDRRTHREDACKSFFNMTSLNYRCIQSSTFWYYWVHIITNIYVTVHLHICENQLSYWLQARHTTVMSHIAYIIIIAIATCPASCLLCYFFVEGSVS